MFIYLCIYFQYEVFCLGIPNKAEFTEHQILKLPFSLITTQKCCWGCFTSWRTILADHYSVQKKVADLHAGSGPTQII